MRIHILTQPQIKKLFPKALVCQLDHNGAYHVDNGFFVSTGDGHFVWGKDPDDAKKARRKILIQKAINHVNSVFAGC